MIRHRSRRLVSLVLLLQVILAAPAMAAHQTTPEGSSDGITLAASGLSNPRGFTWGPDGTMYIAQAGSVPASAESATPVAPADNYIGTLSGNVVRVTAGCPVVFQGNLPSAGGTGGLDLGPADVAILNGQIFVLDEGGGASHGNPLTPDGIYAIDGSGSARLVADIGAWVADNPVANLPEGHDPDGDAVAMVSGGNALWVLESDGGQVLRVTTDGEITRVADLSDGNQQPTGLVAAPDGTVYVGFLTQAPYEDGASRVASISADGTVTDVWTGLTAVIDVTVGPDGTLYALQFGDPDENAPLSVAPDTGRVLRQSGPDSFEEIAIGIDTPIAMGFGPDQGLYVSTPAMSPHVEYGAVIRLDLSQGHVMAMSDALLENSPCVSKPTPTPDGDAATATPGTLTPDAGTGDTPADGTTVTIENFAFGPDALTVSAGTTVTWTNNDTAPHTVTAPDGSFDSGNIAPGETFTFTFTEPGTFDYICSYHPNMTASVVVE